VADYNMSSSDQQFLDYVSSIPRLRSLPKDDADKVHSFTVYQKISATSVPSLPMRRTNISTM